MDCGTLIRSFPTSSISLRHASDRRSAIARVAFGNDAYSKFFSTEFLRFIDEMNVSASDVSIFDILSAAYLNFIACSQTENGQFAVLGDAPLAITFAASCARREILVVSASDPTRWGGYELDVHGRVKFITTIDSLPPRTIQQFVSVNTWMHENGLFFELLTKLQSKPYLSTLAAGFGFQRSRTGSGTRDYFQIVSGATVDISETTDLQQRFLAITWMSPKGSQAS